MYCRNLDGVKGRFDAARRTGGEVYDIRWDVTERCNARERMEDSWVFCPSLPSHGDISAAAVMDDHAGPDVAAFLTRRLVPEIDRLLDPFDQAALTAMCRGLDAECLATPTWEIQGSCLVLAITNQVAGRTLIANVGDCRAAAINPRAGTPLSFLTTDHHPGEPREAERVKASGATVSRIFGQYRVANKDGDLNISRAFGDATFKRNPDLSPDKQAVICDPDFTEFKHTPGDVLLLMSDGMLNNGAAAIAEKRFDALLPLGDRRLHDAMVDLAARSADNLTLLSLEGPWTTRAPPVAAAKRARTDR
jgi:serine/threonine protein phosphatase PrpC